MKGKLGEISQYEHHVGQIPTQPLVDPKNICSMNSHEDNHDESVVKSRWMMMSFGEPRIWMPFPNSEVGRDWEIHMSLV